jgi:hypothetical protein
MLKVIVHNGEARQIAGTSKTTNKPYSFRVQEAYLFTLNKEGQPAPFPEKFEVMLDDNQAPYAPGEYQLHPSSIYLDRQGRVAVSPRLAPLAKRPPAAA